MSDDVVLPCGPLRLVFRREHDRIGHRVEVFYNNKWTPVLGSLEGDANEIWPKSPALQTVHLAERPEGLVALLVGMAGTSHWSASMAANLVRSQLTFDVACRVSGEPKWLGSSYRWLAPQGYQQLVYIEPMSSILKRTEDHSIVLQATPARSANARTIRWDYAIEAWP